jgi:hypothetical protein
MITSSYNGQLLDLEETLDIIKHKDFRKHHRQGYSCWYGWLDGLPLIIRCELKLWQELENEYLHR